MISALAEASRMLVKEELELAKTTAYLLDLLTIFILFVPVRHFEYW